MGVIDSILRIGKGIATNMQRRTKKPFQGYMALEKAEKYLEENATSPKRAPMNVPKKEFSKEELADADTEYKSLIQKNKLLTMNMMQMKIISQDRKNTCLGTESDDTMQRNHPTTNEEIKSKLPKERLQPLSIEQTEIPYGLVKLPDIVNILHNHISEPQAWNAKVISNQFQLRKVDVDNLLKHYFLLTSEEKTTSANSVYLES